eukprot:UN33919
MVGGVLVYVTFLHWCLYGMYYLWNHFQLHLLDKKKLNRVNLFESQFDEYLQKRHVMLVDCLTRNSYDGIVDPSVLDIITYYLWDL